MILLFKLTLKYDCFFIVANGKNSGPLAVVVFVHGEDFAYGAGHPYDPSMFVSHMNLIVVTMSYRVGILGMFSISLLNYLRECLCTLNIIRK